MDNDVKVKSNSKGLIHSLVVYVFDYPTGAYVILPFLILHGKFSLRLIRAAMIGITFNLVTRVGLS